MWSRRPLLHEYKNILFVHSVSCGYDETFPHTSWHTDQEVCFSHRTFNKITSVFLALSLFFVFNLKQENIIQNTVVLSSIHSCHEAFFIRSLNCRLSQNTALTWSMTTENDLAALSHKLICTELNKWLMCLTASGFNIFSQSADLQLPNHKLLLILFFFYAHSTLLFWGLINGQESWSRLNYYWNRVRAFYLGQ